MRTDWKYLTFECPDLPRYVPWGNSSSQVLFARDLRWVDIFCWMWTPSVASNFSSKPVRSNPANQGAKFDGKHWHQPPRVLFPIAALRRRKKLHGRRLCPLVYQVTRNSDDNVEHIFNCVTPCYVQVFYWIYFVSKLWYLSKFLLKRKMFSTPWLLGLHVVLFAMNMLVMICNMVILWYMRRPDKWLKF